MGLSLIIGKYYVKILDIYIMYLYFRYSIMYHFLFQKAYPLLESRHRNWIDLLINYLPALTAFLKSEPALKVATFIAGILIFCFGFLGFTPVLASLLEDLKVPNPWILTSPPFLTESTTEVTNTVMKSPASLLVTPSFFATKSISWVLVMNRKTLKKIKVYLHCTIFTCYCKRLCIDTVYLACSTQYLDI